jgi:ubiquinone/menaquinone biosynthesis C-methylase UbiE
MRNVADKDGQLRRFRGLLRPGGALAVHEYSVRDSRLATVVWNTVCAAIIIPSGRLRSGDAALYRYLRRSVNGFDGAAAFRDRLRDNGFSAVRSETMPGWQHNIVHTFLGQAPR